MGWLLRDLMILKEVIGDERFIDSWGLKINKLHCSCNGELRRNPRKRKYSDHEDKEKNDIRDMLSIFEALGRLLI